MAHKLVRMKINLGELKNLRPYPAAFSKDDGGLTKRKAMEVKVKIKLLNQQWSYIVSVQHYLITILIVLHLQIKI